MESSNKERCLLLCMAYPDYSKKYRAIVCMAGITEEGEFRRIYPIPFEDFKETDYHKRYWIEYEIEGEGDYRKESRKIDPKSVKVDGEMNYIELRNILEEKCTTLEELEEEGKSLGVIKPEIEGFSLDEDEDRRKKAEDYQKQRTLTGGGLPIKIVPRLIRYHFYCGSNCNSLHKIMCEDIEVGMLYWRLIDKWGSLPKVEEKMKEKLVDWMAKERDLYFLMGTHARWKTWLIVSILYPPKRKFKRLDFMNYWSESS